MKFLIFAVLALSVIAEDFYFFHTKKATLQVGNEAAQAFEGPIYLEFTTNANVTVIAGVYKKSKAFFFAAKIDKFVNGSKLVVDGTCVAAGWGPKDILKVNGTVNITGTWKKITYVQTCFDLAKNQTYVIKAEAEYSKCPYYTPVESGKRAKMLIGASRDVINDYPQVLNFAIIGYPYVKNMTCNDYKERWGKEVKEFKPGYVITALNGANCTILDNEGDKFVIYNKAKNTVSTHPVNMLKNFFPGGYMIKDYPAC